MSTISLYKLNNEYYLYRPVVAENEVQPELICGATQEPQSPDVMSVTFKGEEIGNGGYFTSSGQKLALYLGTGQISLTGAYGYDILLDITFPDSHILRFEAADDDGECIGNIYLRIRFDECIRIKTIHIPKTDVFNKWFVLD